MKKISLTNTFNSVNNELKHIINHHKNPSYYNINEGKNNNNINKHIQESKSFLSSDYTISGITLDQTKINYDKIKPQLKKQNFNFLNSKEHRNFMKIFNYNITKSISKNKIDKNTILYNESLKHSVEIRKNIYKINNIKTVKNIKSVKNKKNINLSPPKVSNNSKSTIIINNKNSEKNLSHNSSLISETSIFNSKPSISITSTISFSKKDSLNNSKNKNDDIPMTYSEDENTLRHKKEDNENFQSFYERINKKLFGC